MNDFQSDYDKAFELWFNRQKAYDKRKVLDCTKRRHMNNDLHNLSCSKWSYWTRKQAEFFYLNWLKYYLELKLSAIKNYLTNK